MKTFCRIFASFLPIILALTMPLHAAEIWVAPDGNNANPGTMEKPMGSLEMGLRKARDMRRLDQVMSNEPIKILLRGGAYPLASPVLVRSEDSGTETSPTIIAAAENEKPILSGGVPVSNWKLVTEPVPGLLPAGRGEVWVADAPRFGGRVLEIRQLWVNGRKAIRAREPNDDNLNRLLSWNRKDREAGIPASLIRSLRDLAGVEMVIHQQWEIAVCRIKAARFEDDTAFVSFHEPESTIEFEHPWPQPVMSKLRGNAPFFLANALEFLDEPGEWFQDVPGGKIYYWPQPGEIMATTQAIAPALETLVTIEGSPDRPVAHVQFKGIQFEHTTWMRPSQFGHVPLQAGMFMLDACKLSPKGTSYHRGLDNQAWIGRPPGAVSVQNANHVRFERCVFEHLASAGLDVPRGTHDDAIVGCTFRDIGGNGIQLGTFSEEGVETHVPYDPSDKREICTRELIANNLVTDCANEDWGGVGIIVGYGREISIEHNEVNHVSYTGISLGWGWTKATNCMADNRIVANHIHHVATRMCDTAGIYTLSAQPGTVVSRNSVHNIRMSPYVFDPEHWFYLYLDEGSSFVTVRDNWCPEERFLKNANGPGNVWENNGPKVSDEIRDAAGLEPAFRDLGAE